MANAYYLGFDIGGTNARCSFLEHRGDGFKILASQKHSIRGAQTPADVAQVIRNVVDSLPKEFGASADDLAGIGVAIAGQIAIDEHTVLNAPNLNWHDVDFYAAIRGALGDLATGADIRIANDLNAIAWGEYHFGAARSIASLLAVYVGTGIGGGLIIDGKLMLGADNVSGEIGHCKFPQFMDYPCGCGQHGCVEAFAGGKAIEYRILHDIQTGVVSRADLGLGESEHPTARCIERTCKTLAYSRRFWEETSAAIGMLISNAVAILNPHGLLLGGGVLEGCPELLTQVVEHIMEWAPRSATANLQFIKPTLHDDAGTLGAALLCLK